MTGTNFPSGVSSFGIPVIGGAILTTGNIFFVDSGSANRADDTAHGKSPTKPFSTWDYAVGQCTANNGDHIILMPGHTETIATAAALDLDVAGITCIGIGRGTDQPRLDFTATAGTVEVNADNIAIHNINFHANVSAIVIGLSVLTLATDLLVEGCIFDVETTATDEFLIAINFGVGCDRFTVKNCIIDQGLGGAAHAIKLVGATAGGTIQGNRIVGDYSVANIGGITTLSTEIYILDNDLINGASGNINAQPVIEMLTGTTGMVARNYITADLATQAAATVGDTLVYFENFRSDEAGAGITGHTSAASIVISADA